MQRTAHISRFFAGSTAALVLAMLFAASPAFARDPAPATQATGLSASSRVMFRVIVKERLDASTGLKRRTDRRSTAQRQILVSEGRQLLTIAAL